MEDTRQQIIAVRQTMGWYDRSGMGKLAITGPDRYSWLQGMVSNDVRLLENRSVRRLAACILDPTGHVLADITLIDFPADSFPARYTLGEAFVMVETPPGFAAVIGNHLRNFLIMEDAEVRDIPDSLRCLSVQGPGISEIEPIIKAAGEFAVAVAADHTGSGGMDIYSPAQQSNHLRATLSRVAPVEIGAAAQEVLRIEAGIPKYGADMDATTLAPEAGLMQTHISLTKGCYVGQEIVARIDSRGHTNRALTGLLILGETVPVPGEKLFADDAFGEGKEAGRITSVAAVSPSVGGRPIALGYVRHEHRAAGSWVRLGSADSLRMAEITELPFFQGPVRASAS